MNQTLVTCTIEGIPAQSARPAARPMIADPSPTTRLPRTFAIARSEPLVVLRCGDVMLRMEG